NGDQPLPVIAQVSLAGNAQNAPLTLKDLKFWTAEEKKTRMIDCLARSLLIQGLLNDIYSLIDSNETAKDLWDALERHMCSSEYICVKGFAASEVSKPARGKEDTPLSLCLSSSRKLVEKSCEKNYSSMRRYVADPVNVFLELSITKLILKEAVIFNVIRPEGASIQSSDLPLSTSNTVGSGEDRMVNAIELTDPVPQTPMIHLSQEVLDMENVKTAQAKEIASLQKRVTKLKQKQSSRILGSDSCRMPLTLSFRSMVGRDYSLTIEIFVRDKISRDVITVGSTMRIPLLYRGEYSQWHERFLNYLEEKMDGEAMINSIQNGDHPLPVVAHVSFARTAQNAPPTLKDPKFWTAEEKKTRKLIVLQDLF
nr:hypothetical protein [Tanacetum cinerariifolium]